MIHEIRSFCQIIENSSNKHFCLIDLNTPSAILKAASSVDIPFPKIVPFCDQYVVGIHVLA
jgi:hypothetical protein